MADHGSAASVGHLPFSATEWEELKKEDRHGGTMVIGLMASIFTIGLLLYIGVLLSVAL